MAQNANKFLIRRRKKLRRSKNERKNKVIIEIYVFVFEYVGWVRTGSNRGLLLKRQAIC